MKVIKELREKLQKAASPGEAMTHILAVFAKCVVIVVACVLLWYALAVVAVAAGGAVMWVLGL